MAEFRKGMSGKPLNLIDNGDGTFSFQVVPINTVQNLLQKVSDNSLITNNSLHIMSTLRTDGAGGTNLDVSKYRNLSVFILNNHDQTIQVRLEKKVNSSYQGVGKYISDFIEIPAYSQYCFEPKSYPLMTTPAPYLYGEIKQTAKPPTAGSINVYIFGEAR